ncbi:cold-shock protein [Gynuella sunshinyii]|uniref:Cold shock protein n=1 Tax=Gynuella sunshinyii YC6258 TaxID=1445510 RepID=A0A0C5VR97_9GAMM|nr:cold shock domain-containing protein [Gynuella sunshinyii]AJQ96756.1 cold shock protein [Gynuella sunshinyii YC6258]
MNLKIFNIRLILSLIIALAAPFIFLAVAKLSMESTGLYEFIASLSGTSKVTMYAIGVIATAITILFGLYIDAALNDSEVIDDREEGVVKWFNVSKGFGFVTRENGDDVFVHFRSIRGRGHRSLQEGQRVKFGLVESSKGLQAEDVSVIRHQ